MHPAAHRSSARATQRSLVQTDQAPLCVVTLVHLRIETIQALADGDAPSALRDCGLPLSEFVMVDRALWVWQLTVAADLDAAAQARWLACAAVTPEGTVIGHAGFHGPPREGMAEIGYSVDPAWRRRGYGRAIVGALLDEVHLAPDVHRVRASINTTNTASFATVGGFGFVQVGERAVEGGRETILERTATTGGIRQTTTC